jgi:glycosyltransferase involved in cell wall biosynthesis
MLKVNAYTGGISVPSARYRIRQHIPLLERHGVFTKEFISKSGMYPPDSKIRRPIWLIRNIAENASKYMFHPHADVIFFQREMLSTFSTFETCYKEQRVFDVDDAIFLYRGGKFTKKIASSVQKVICGNDYLAEYFSKYNKNIDVIHTAVDVHQYTERPKIHNDYFTILWSGSSSGFPYLYEIQNVIAKFINKYKDSRLLVLSDKEPVFDVLKKDVHYIYIKWSSENEHALFRSSDVGIMPMPDTEWTRGKCSYKMICYMAAHLPVIVSPYGMNADVLAKGEIGVGCKSFDDWFAALEMYYMSSTLRHKHGQNAIEVAMSHYDIQIISAKLARALKNI